MPKLTMAQIHNAAMIALLEALNKVTNNDNSEDALAFREILVDQFELKLYRLLGYDVNDAAEKVALPTDKEYQAPKSSDGRTLLFDGFQK